MALTLTNHSEISWTEAFDDFILRMKATREEKTAKYYHDLLVLLVRWSQDNQISLHEFRARHLSKYLVYRATPGQFGGKAVSDLTRRHDASCARVFLRFCFKQGYIDTNPLADYELPARNQKVGACPSTEQVRQLLISIRKRFDVERNPDMRFMKASTRRFLGLRNYAIVASLIETAARPGEILSLKVQDCDLTLMKFTLRDTKTDEDRSPPISVNLKPVIEEYLKVRPKESASPNLFVNEYGDDLTVEVFSKRFRGQLKWAGIAGFSLYGLRHYSITQISEHDLRAAQQIAGHKSLSTTQIYLHPNADHVRAMHAAASPLGNVVEPSDAPLMVNKRTERKKRQKLV
ncbi:hypothetical protein CCAX7_14150 [Capsulimonas corticalis]|uniref:Uncharacterized protein n=1 Tax=Capsulimonas corticalis TaxID=2219043 RepID=A0A402D6Z7_9BACT|nr:hypothetical protein CCAX7_14150 [Capsulimonas corticalis]